MQIVINMNENDYKTLMINGGNCSISMAERIVNSVYQGKRLPKCHGDLKDVNMICNELDGKSFNTSSDYHNAIDAVDDAPTIIEADAESEDEE